MDFRDGAPVFTSSGKKVGEIAGVVLDPSDREVIYLIVERGFLLSRDRLVDVNTVTSATADGVTLSEDVDPDDLIPYKDTEFISVADDLSPLVESEPSARSQVPGVSHSVVWYAPFESAAAYPAHLPTAIRVAQHTTPPTSTIEMGDKVISSDGEHLGKVERIITSDGEVTGLVIEKGVFFTEERAVPASWVASIEEGEVRLGVVAALVERTPAPSR